MKTEITCLLASERKQVNRMEKSFPRTQVENVSLSRMIIGTN